MLVWLGMVVINPFHVTGSFLYPLKTSGFPMFLGVIERPVVWNWLMAGRV